MNTLNSENVVFESAIKQHFGFLEEDHGFHYSGIREIDDGPRDRGLVARYSRDDIRIDIGWSSTEGSLSVLIHLEMDDLSRSERFVYLEPFIEFTTNGAISPVVPQIYPGMSVSSIEDIITRRAELLENGVGHALNLVASRLKKYYSTIRDASADEIHQYHKWYQARGRAA